MSFMGKSSIFEFLKIKSVIHIKFLWTIAGDKINFTNAKNIIRYLLKQKKYKQLYSSILRGVHKYIYLYIILK